MINKEIILTRKEENKVLPKMEIICSLIFLSLFFSISIVSATSLVIFGEGFITIEQDECFNIFATCDNCTYMNLTILSPNGTVLVENSAMTNVTSMYYYNYTFCNTHALGTHPIIFNYDEDYSGYLESEADFFDVTPTGNADNIGFYFILLILSLGIIILGFILKDAPITIIGSFGLYFIGLHILFYGINGLKDPVYTWAIGLLILCLAAYISTRSSWELISSSEM
jgi:hypothetical protein